MEWSGRVDLSKTYDTLQEVSKNQRKDTQCQRGGATVVLAPSLLSTAAKSERSTKVFP
jgi:hypothetical protein